MSNENDLVFYHGGVNKNFNIDQIDLFKVGDKQQKSGSNYIGFYMYDSNGRNNAFNYAINKNKSNNTNDNGVIKITIDKDSKIFNVDSFGAITRQTKEDLEKLQKQGYDLVKGKMFPKDEYVLLNKSKIKSIEFESLSKEILNQRKQILSLISGFDRSDEKINIEMIKVEQALNLINSMDIEKSATNIYEDQKDLIFWLKSRGDYLERKKEEYNGISGGFDL